MNPRPLRTALEAVALAQAEVGTGTYELGTGNADTPRDGASDCVWAIVKCYGIPRHRPGFNRGADNSRGDVEDDINCNSAIDDALQAGHGHTNDLFVAVQNVGPASAFPKPGDILAYPTIHLAGHPPFIGHVCIVEATARFLAWFADGNTWSWDAPRWDLLDVIHCHGPNGCHPAIARTTGGIWAAHDKLWPKPEHRSVLLRVVP